jgi:hypothetical protein
MHYSVPDGMQARFEYYRVLLDDINQIKEYLKVKQCRSYHWVVSIVLAAQP